MKTKRNILVTGGNRGIGLAIVKGFAKNSEDTILLGCRSLKDGQKEAEAIGKNVIPVEIRLADREELEKDIKAVLQRFGRIDVLVNNAGVLHKGTFSEIPMNELDDSLRVNVLGPYELIRAVTPGMRENHYGRIVNMASGWGSFEDGLTGPFSYSFAKASLNALTLTISRDLPPNIKINSMCPGWVKTRMGGEEAPRSPEEGADTAIWLGNLDQDGPSGGFFRDRERIGW